MGLDLRSVSDSRPRGQNVRDTDLVAERITTLERCHVLQGGVRDVGQCLPRQEGPRSGCRVYAVTPEEPVDVVVEKMANHKYGSTVMMNLRGDVEGIFTTVDALQVLVDVLRRATA